MQIDEIKKFMKENKITYDLLAEKSGLSISTIKKIFSKQAKYPRIDTMQAIEHTLGLDEPVINWYMLTPDENELVTEYRKLVPSMQAYILDSVKKLNAAQSK